MLRNIGKNKSFLSKIAFNEQTEGKKVELYKKGKNQEKKILTYKLGD